MTDESNMSTFFSPNNKTLIENICCANVKTISTVFADKQKNIFIGDPDLNITKEQRDEWFKDIQTSFPEFKFTVHQTDNIYKKLVVPLLPAGFLDSPTVRHNLEKKGISILQSLSNNTKYSFKAYGKTHKDIKTAFCNGKLFIPQDSKFRIYLVTDHTGLDVFVNLLNIQMIEKSSNTPISIHTFLFNELELNKNTLPGILISSNFHKIQYGTTPQARSLSETFRLMLFTFLRYTWSTMYNQYLPLYFKIKQHLPDKEMLEILSLANILAHEKPYYSLFPIRENGLLNIQFIRNRMKDHLQKKTVYNSLNTISTRHLDMSDFHIIKRLLIQGRYIEAFNVFESSTNLHDKVFPFKVKAKQDYGMVQKDFCYSLKDQNHTSYKILADDYKYRWYKQIRFTKELNNEKISITP